MSSRSRTYVGTYTANLNTYGTTVAQLSTLLSESYSSGREGEFITGLSITNNTDETYNTSITSDGGSTTLVSSTRLLPRTTTQILTANDKLSLNSDTLVIGLSGIAGRYPSATGNTDQVSVAITYTFRRES
jgi:hypothetical protein